MWKLTTEPGHLRRISGVQEEKLKTDYFFLIYFFPNVSSVNNFFLLTRTWIGLTRYFTPQAIKRWDDLKQKVWRKNVQLCLNDAEKLPVRSTRAFSSYRGTDVVQANVCSPQRQKASHFLKVKRWILRKCVFCAVRTRRIKKKNQPKKTLIERANFLWVDATMQRVSPLWPLFFPFPSLPPSSSPLQRFVS